MRPTGNCSPARAERDSGGLRTFPLVLPADFPVLALPPLPRVLAATLAPVVVVVPGNAGGRVGEEGGELSRRGEGEGSGERPRDSEAMGEGEEGEKEKKEGEGERNKENNYGRRVNEEL